MAPPRRPAAWRVRVKGGKIQLWQVYVDTKVVFDLIAYRGRRNDEGGS
jgi:hypothetical protein